MLNNHMLLVTPSNYVFHKAKIYLLYQQTYFTYGIQVLLAFISFQHFSDAVTIATRNS